MLKFVLQEMPELHEGHRQIFPKLMVYSQIGNEKLVEEFKNYGMVSGGMVSGVLNTLPDILRRYLTEGHTVKVDGLGTFSLSLEFDDDKPTEITKDGEEESYRHVRVRSINFRPDTNFLKQIKRDAQFERVESKVRCMDKPKYSMAERLQRLQDYLANHPSITLTQYVVLNCTSRTSASLDLKYFTADPSSGINVIGSGSHKVWVKSE